MRHSFRVAASSVVQPGDGVKFQLWREEREREDERAVEMWERRRRPSPS
jgi:hypothetical protein